MTAGLRAKRWSCIVWTCSRRGTRARGRLNGLMLVWDGFLAEGGNGRGRMTMKDLSDGVVRLAARVGAAACLVLASAGPDLAQRGGAMARSAERRVETMKRQGAGYEGNKATSERRGAAQTAEERARGHPGPRPVQEATHGFHAPPH